MVVATVHRLEQLFRRAAGLDLDKTDLGRLEDFIHRKVEDILVRGEANAKANGRDVVQLWDLPITKGLQETIHSFRMMNAELQLTDFLTTLISVPPLDLAISDETEARLFEIAGALCIALAKTLKITNEDLKNPMTEDWERAYQLFDLLL
jgi:hypothetical protein